MPRLRLAAFNPPSISKILPVTTPASDGEIEGGEGDVVDLPESAQRGLHHLGAHGVVREHDLERRRGDGSHRDAVHPDPGCQSAAMSRVMCDSAAFAVP